ncbi:MAG: CDP-diacylglycerol--glycerol-3-phosphate 3-phosphatidyltransferase [Lachnospiraceae bacterium]|nr:CDP-diacylglycerol--glycerol-3-phosphate 3-phosphatidyltransferase [Lachnospiraceae bacterium]
MNLPNKLTVLRMILVPVFVFICMSTWLPFNFYFALFIFVVASLTDMLDGKIARARNLVTNFGKFMDPLADKLLVVSALICLLIVENGERYCCNQVVAMIAVLIIVGREFVISGFRLVASDAGVVIAASIWGKVKTATTMVAICFMLVVKEFSAFIPAMREITMALFWISVTLTVVSLVDYVVKNIDVMKEKKKPKFDEETGLPIEE